MVAACEILFIRGQIKRDEGISFNLVAASTTRKYRVFTEKLTHGEFRELISLHRPKLFTEFSIVGANSSLRSLDPSSDSVN